MHSIQKNIYLWSDNTKKLKTMEIVLDILAILCVVVGIAGCIIPLLPGPPICCVGILLARWAGADISTEMLIIWAVVAVGVTLIDNFLPVVMTKKFGGSKAATWGSTIGIVVGLFLGPVGIILGPFFGALVGELIHDRSSSAKAFKVAFGSFAAFVCGTGIKLVAAVYMSVSVFKFVFGA